MRLLLDTNAYAGLLRGTPAVATQVREAEGVCMSAVVIGELLMGFRLGSRVLENSQALSRFLANPYVETLPITRVTADHFGSIAASLRRHGTPIPTNDIWIAAHAVEHGVTLLSGDEHFAAVDGLLWLRPQD